MGSHAIMENADWIIYTIQGSLAVWGVYCVVFALRQIRRRRFDSQSEADSFLDTFRAYLEEGEFDTAAALCAEPAHVYRSLPILAGMAVVKRHLSPNKLRQLLAAKFEREILGKLENARTTINTIAKSEPMLGLLGTVVGMIGAFGKMATGERVTPQMLSAEIGIALTATAIGLIVAVPLVLASNFIEIKMRSMEDATVEGMQVVLDDLEAVQAT